MSGTGIGRRGSSLFGLGYRGIMLLVELLEAADHVGRYKLEEMSALLRETAELLRELLKRDIPAQRRPND